MLDNNFRKSVGHSTSYDACVNWNCVWWVMKYMYACVMILHKLRRFCSGWMCTAERILISLGLKLTIAYCFVLAWLHWTDTMQVQCNLHNTVRSKAHSTDTCPRSVSIVVLGLMGCLDTVCYINCTWSAFGYYKLVFQTIAAAVLLISLNYDKIPWQRYSVVI